MPPNLVSVTITGEITLDDVAEALRKHFTAKTVRVDRGGEVQSKEPNPKEIVVAYSPSSDQLENLRALLERKTKELKEMEASSSKALASMQTFQQQQKQLLDEFVLLHQKYDEQKLALVHTLWVYCSQYHPQLKNIPHLENDDFEEGEEQVGQYNLGELLGEGQFAAVRTCWKGKNSDKELAIKIIKKDRITTFLALSRLSDEIGLLKRLQNEYVINIKEVFQTQKHLYIITEKGGSDMFEFFDDHAEGVPEPWAKDIMACILISVQACHEAGICHRDLKPENILLTFDYDTESVVDLKLCDFGLGCLFEPRVPLSDFCGSPGFFCPEMITLGTYYGDKADVWSIGGIILELIMGNERFCNAWMGAYEYEVLQSRDRFAREIEETVQKLPSALDFHPDLNDFILSFVKLAPNQRPTIAQMMQHKWVAPAVEKMKAHAKKMQS